MGWLVILLTIYQVDADWNIPCLISLMTNVPHFVTTLLCMQIQRYNVLRSITSEGSMINANVLYSFPGTHTKMEQQNFSSICFLIVH